MAEKKDPNDKDQNKDDEDYGMPKVDITPIGESQKASPTPAKGSSEEEDKSTEEVPVAALPEEEKPVKEKKSRSGFFLILLLLLLFGAGFALYYVGVFDQWGEAPPATSSAPPAADEPAEEVVPPAPEELAADNGTDASEEETFFLTEITSKINVPRYFVVVGSFIDSDLAKDYSNRLNNMNKSTFLIHPYGDIAFYRLAVGQHENLSEALTHMEDIQGDFEENLWVLKY